MAKRRPVRPESASQDEEEARESPEDRRARRQRERRARQKRGSKAPGVFSAWPRWKTASVLGGSAVAIVAAIAVVLLVLPHPCLAISPPPAGSGVPDESAPSWCVNSSVSMEQRLNVHLSIQVGGSNVMIPGGIGEISQAKWGWTCTMPVFTDNSTGPGGGDSGGIIEIASPWNFTYTISDFFNMWKESYSSVSINGNSEPVSYTGTQLFNYSTTANQAVRLWVDGQVSQAGTGLVLNYLSNNYQTSNEVPQCFLQQYGSGHTIFITWGWKGAGLVVSGPAIFQAPGATLDPSAGPIDPFVASHAPKLVELAAATAAVGLTAGIFAMAVRRTSGDGPPLSPR